MTEVKVKICGLTRSEDVQNAIRCGADAVGFVFARSPRRVSLAQGKALSSGLPGSVLKVGLFMDPEPAEVEVVLREANLDWLQFHGRESNEFCQSFGMPYLKAISMRETDPATVAAQYAGATAILLDSHSPGGSGGTGAVFDWTRRVASAKPLWLAGGLTPDNVGQAIEQFAPDAVDVSSGVELTPGIKSDERVREFILRAKRTNHEPD